MVKQHHHIHAVIPGGNGANALGVVRSFGRHNIPVVYIDSEPKAIARHSRYITRRVKCQTLLKSGNNFIDRLMHLGKTNNRKAVIIPTGDLDALSISKHKDQLEQFFYIPIPEYPITKMMICKNDFYPFLEEKGIDHPRALVPEDMNELISLKTEMPYPFIIKPSNSILFQQEFSKKCFIIHSPREFDKAVQKLKGMNLDVMVQEIIPGNDIYAIYMYFNKAAKPLAICGYDKLRHYPIDFGNGSFCRSKWRDLPIRVATDLLTGIGYHGIAELEFIKDPRDGKYKLIEINARTSLQNRLPAGCDLDIEYIAYLDVSGQRMIHLKSPNDNVEWIDDMWDYLSRTAHLIKGRYNVKDFLTSSLKRKIHSVAAWDDPVPLFIRFFSALKSFFRTKLPSYLDYSKK